MESKSIFLSKSFWFNIATAATTFGGLLPPKFAVPVSVIGNILLRIVTNQPVNIFPSSK